MFKEKINFKYNLPITYDAWDVGYYHLHCHEGVTEVLMILDGKAFVKSSFEEFEMDAGDYIVIREMDSHSFSSAGLKCEVLSLYFRTEDYKKQIPFLDAIQFACESFDLAKYRNETIKLRKMISSIVYNLIKSEDINYKNAKKEADALLWIFVQDYDTITYYNRNWDVSFKKKEMYYKIMTHVSKNYSMKNLLDYISEQEHYSKSYITHFIKEVGNSSFKDLIDYIKLAKSEEMLLDSDAPISLISDTCGYSDIKYYIKNFKKWFNKTPAEYRKVFQPEVNKKSVFKQIDDITILKRVEKFLADSDENTQFKASVNPISVKAFSKEDNFFKLNDSVSVDALSDVAKHVGDTNVENHSIVIKLNDKASRDEKELLFTYADSFTLSGFNPVFVADLREMSMVRCKAVISECAEYFLKKNEVFPSILLIYNDLGDYGSINTVLSEIKEKHNCDTRKIMPLFIP